VDISILGAGLAGCEAALALSGLGISVRLIEMKPARFSPAHSSSNFAELVCSNSLRSASLNSAVGLLKQELRLLGSVVMYAADIASVPAGKALAVNRKEFSELITRIIENSPLITIERKEALELPCESDDTVIIATGPLTSDSLAKDISDRLGSSGLYFYDAIAPIVYAESLDMSKLFRASRYETGEGDYLNAPMDRENQGRTES
jgi:methylenetetrahydrofolate--tRNA-(uracil-5-)-methyltransferase